MKINKFCKLVEHPETQILVMYDTNDDGVEGISIQFDPNISMLGVTKLFFSPSEGNEKEYNLDLFTDELVLGTVNSQIKDLQSAFQK